MRKIILTILVVLAGAYPVQADTVWLSGHHEIVDGDVYGEIYMYNDATAAMFGGDVYKLETYDYSTFDAIDGIMDLLYVHENSTVNIHGGNLDALGATGVALVNLYAYDVIYHPTGGHFDRGWIEGKYVADDILFSFDLNHLDTFSHINVVPEPGTITVGHGAGYDFNTIQAAIDAANNGNTVLVHDGVYKGPGNRDISFRGKAIRLRSVNGSTNSIIEVGASQSEWHNGFYLHEGENETSIINGFTVTGGYTYQGGGIFLDGSSPTIKNCIVTGNTGGWGGGVAFYNSDATIINCLISGNKGWDAAGGIYCRNRNPKITNCTITGNWSEVRGGGVYCQETSLTVANCILWDNLPQPQISDRSGNSTISVTYSDVEGGWEDHGNIDIDPCFVEQGYWDINGVWVEGDYRLLEDSPCIDVGDPNYIPEPNETDLDGKPRVIGGRIDMGAYEYTPPIAAQINIKPKTLNLRSKGKSIACRISLPEGYNVDDIDPNSILLEWEIEAVRVWVNEHEQVAMAKFNRAEIQGILEPGQVGLTVTGELIDGTRFEGSDTIKVIDKHHKG